MLFAENQQQTGGRIHYVLFNPWAVRSNEALNSFDSPLMKLLARAIYAIVGVSVEEAIAPITHLIDNPPHTALSAFIKTKPVDLTMNTFDRGKAVRTPRNRTGRWIASPLDFRQAHANHGAYGYCNQTYI